MRKPKTAYGNVENVGFAAGTSQGEDHSMLERLTLACCTVLLMAGGNSGEEARPRRRIEPQADRSEVAKAIARRWFDEVINQRNVDVIAEIYSADYVHHGPEGAEIRGLETVRRHAASILAASNDRRAVVEQQIAEGDLVVTRFTSSGHHTGMFQGVEPTGEVWTTEGIVISRIEHGRIAEDWEIVHHSGF